MAREHPGPISLMITDVRLPKFSGSVLVERVAAIRPETRILYASGYNDDLATLSHVPGQEHAFLAKPFTRRELLGKVRELLDLAPQAAH
jgi:response regulator RpfG family c-di-GMP phosphodiesterase